MKTAIPVLASLVLAGWVAAFPAMAGVVISGTRVVLPARAGEATVQLHNTGSSPVLVQSWIDEGDATQTPEQSRVPFLITPPITRVEAGQGQALRILHSGGELPGDRESVFWLNVLEVPPLPEQADSINYLQFAIRSRIKLFYRPDDLAGSAATAPEHLVWQRAATGDVRVHNPTAYHVTITGVEAFDGEAQAGGTVLEASGTMLAPGQSQSWPVPLSASRVEFTTINDYGARVPHAAVITRRGGS